MFASRSAIESESSAKAGSKALRGKCPSPPLASRAESRNEERDEGRNGVVGRDVWFREVGRRSGELAASEDIVRRTRRILRSKVGSGLAVFT